MSNAGFEGWAWLRRLHFFGQVGPTQPYLSSTVLVLYLVDKKGPIFDLGNYIFEPAFTGQDTHADSMARCSGPLVTPPTLFAVGLVLQSFPPSKPMKMPVSACRSCSDFAPAYSYLLLTGLGRETFVETWHGLEGERKGGGGRGM